MASRHPTARLGNSVTVPATNAVVLLSTPRVNMTTTLSPPIMAHPGVSIPRRNRLNRSIPGSLSGWRWGWLRGTLPESPVDHRTSKLLKICLVSSHVTSQNLLTSRFQKNCLVSSHVTLPLEPGAAPGLRAEGLCQGHRGELRSYRRREYKLEDTSKISSSSKDNNSKYNNSKEDSNK